MYRVVPIQQESSLYSISSMSHDEEQISTSSAPTSTHSSPYNAHKTQVTDVQDIESPDLLQAGFYNSDNGKDHSSNLRKSMVISESLESVKLTEAQEKNTPTGQIAITNSPSLSALAAILEKKSTKYHPSPLHSNVSMDTITAKEETQVSTQSQLRPIQVVSSDISPVKDSSPNLIQIDDNDDSFTIAADNSLVNTHQESHVNADIFETPQIPRYDEFPKQMKHSTSLATVIEKSPVHPMIPEIINTPDLYQGSTGSIDSSVRSSPKVSQHTPRLSQSTTESNSLSPAGSSQVLPKLNKDLGSTHYKQRSSSLPVLTNPKEQKKKRGFMSFFRSSKRSVSQGVEQVELQSQNDGKMQKQKVDKKRPTLKPSVSHNDLSTQQSKVAKRSTSTNSLFSSFKRKSKVLQISPESEKIDSPVKSSISSHHSSNDFGEFNEDFNNLKIDPSLPRESEEIIKKASQVSNGEILFPKSLNRQEVESIVSLERNRSVRSRHSVISNRQNRMSLTEAIQSNAKDEGMSIEFGREISTPDLTKSPQSSVLKKHSINSFKKYLSDDEQDEGELFDVEEFTQSLEFDNIAESYEAVQDEEDDDISKLIEFADFINFGDDLELNFDLPASETESPYNSPDPSRISTPLSAPPLNSPSLNQSPAFSVDGKSNTSLKQPSPLSSPFLQQISFMSNEAPGTLARPISMSFKGLRAPAFENPRNIIVGVSDDTSSFHSYKSERSRRSLNQQRTVTFSSKITLYDAFHEDEYDRHPDIATCNQLTPAIAQMIKDELNALKAEMEIHESSHCYTHFY